MLELLLSQMKGVGWASVLSIGLHGALAWAVMQAPAGWLGAAERRSEPVAFEILAPERPEIVETAQIPQRPLPPPQGAADTLPRDERPNRPPSETRAGAIEANAVELGPVLPSNIEVPEIQQTEPPRPAAIDPHSERARVMFDPRNVARGGFVPTGPGPSQRSGPAGVGYVGLRPRSEREIEESLGGGLRRQAMAKTHITREPVVPQRQADGSYLWQGPMFQARIARDGEVTFEDQADINTNGFSASGSFDIQGALMGAAGQDPRQAERNRFMRETRELRERLEDEAWARERRQAARTMRGNLVRTWARTERSEYRRRRHIFVLWDRIAEDGSMTEVREAVIAWVRENLPEGGEHQFTDAELREFNAHRQSRERFDPYR